MQKIRSPLFLFLLKKPCHTEIVLFFTFWLTCAYFFPERGGWNDNSRLDLIYCMVEDHTFIIEKYKDLPGFETADTSLINGIYYSNKSPGMSFLGIPSYIAFRWLIPKFGLDRDDHKLRRWWMVNTVVSLAGALAASLLFRILITYGLAVSLAAALATFFSLGTIHFGFSTLYYPYSTVTFFLLLAFLMFRGVAWKRSAEGTRFSHWMLLGFFVGIAAFIDFPATMIAVGFSVYALYLTTLGLHKADFLSLDCPFYKRFGGFAIGGILGILPYFLYSLVAFGRFLNVYDYQAVGFFDQGIKTGPFGFLGLRPTVIYYLLIHPYRGLFFHSPILIMAIPGWILMIKEKRHIGDAILTFYIFSIFTIYFAGYFVWWGGWGYGPRFLIPVVAWLFIPIAFLAKQSVGPARRAIWVLGIISVILHFMATAVDPNIAEIIDYKEARDPKFVHNYKSPVLTLSYSAFIRGKIQPNLGTKLYLQGRSSLYPLYVFLAFMFCLHYRKKDAVDLDDPLKRFTGSADEST